MDKILNQNKDGTTELDALQKSLASAKAKKCEEFFQPPMTNCLCGVFSLRGGTGIFALADVLNGAANAHYWVSWLLSGYLDIWTFVYTLPWIILFAGAVFGLIGAISEKSNFVGFYIVALQFFQVVAAVTTILLLFNAPSSFVAALINWIVYFVFLWWKCAVGNAYCNQLGGGQHSLLSAAGAV